MEKYKGFSNFIFFIIKLIFLLQIINTCKTLDCNNRDSPFEKFEECIKSCTIYEISSQNCKINNEIIKNQWLIIFY